MLDQMVPTNLMSVNVVDGFHGALTYISSSPLYACLKISLTNCSQMLYRGMLENLGDLERLKNSVTHMTWKTWLCPYMSSSMTL